MRLAHRLTLLAGVLALAACNQSGRDETAETVEENAEARAENIEEAAEDAPNEAVEANLENRADLVRNLGEESADAVRNGAGSERNPGQ